MESFNTPVLFMIFNRLDTTKKIFYAIANQRPSKLYIASDGPRTNPNEDKVVNEVRDYVLSNINWNCEVKTLFRNENQGCKLAVSSAVNWFFENEEQGIILEDDCLPNEAFFPYCETLLNRYRDDERIMHIAGTNIQNGIKRGDGQYYFSKICHIWGWATWRRAWEKYDVNMKSYPYFLKANGFNSIFDNKKYCNYWNSIFDRVYNAEINTWDYQWVYTIWTQGGLCVAPQVNLISNIGFGKNATHTSNSDDYFANRSTSKLIDFSAPSLLLQDKEADNYSMELFLAKPSIIKRVKSKLSKVKSKLVKNDIAYLIPFIITVSFT